LGPQHAEGQVNWLAVEGGSAALEITQFCVAVPMLTSEAFFRRRSPRDGNFQRVLVALATSRGRPGSLDNASDLFVDGKHVR